ncbi:MAG TPA: DedA family protein [Gaiellaceae bacterium]|nr:DedA family protein [Gaiellaceae bacterium]
MALLACAAALLHFADDGDGFGLIDGDGSQTWQYISVLLLIAADAVLPIFPSESTLNAASTLAAGGELEIQLVVVVGALGAIVGDSVLYWISRRSGSRVRRRLEKAKEREKVAAGLALLGSSAPLLIVAGRYVPGLRFVVNATMGLAAYPYRRFLLWSAIGASTWSLYTCLLAYWIGSALADYPLASIVISGSVTTVFLVALSVVWRRGRAAADGSVEAATP